jgi:hypothetical protein
MSSIEGRTSQVQAVHSRRFSNEGSQGPDIKTSGDLPKSSGTETPPKTKVLSGAFISKVLGNPKRRGVFGHLGASIKNFVRIFGRAGQGVLGGAATLGGVVLTGVAFIALPKSWRKCVQKNTMEKGFSHFKRGLVGIPIAFAGTITQLIQVTPFEFSRGDFEVGSEEDKVNTEGAHGILDAIGGLLENMDLD